MVGVDEWVGVLAGDGGQVVRSRLRADGLVLLDGPLQMAVELQVGPAVGGVVFVVQVGAERGHQAGEGTQDSLSCLTPM